MAVRPNISKSQYLKGLQSIAEFWRYRHRKKDVSEEFNDENEEEHKRAERMFVNLVLRWWKKQQELDGDLVLNRHIIRKGLDATNSRVEFADGTIWAIPKRIKEQVLDLE